jgi:predicted CoA-binding protein
MQRVKDAEFLVNKRVAVTGVSRKPDRSHGAKFRLPASAPEGYQVFAINPNATRPRMIVAATI